MQSDINEAAGGAISSNRAELTEQRAETFSKLSGNWKWDKTFQNKHKFNLLFGFSLEDQTNNAISTTVNGFVTNVPILDFGENPQNPLGTKTQRRSLSYFSRLNYNFKERYLFEANVRYDGSSRFYKAIVGECFLRLRQVAC